MNYFIYVYIYILYILYIYIYIYSVCVCARFWRQKPISLYEHIPNCLISHTTLYAG